MTNLSPRDALRTHYQDSTRFNARVRLHILFSTNPQGWTRWIFEQIRLPATGRMLELGCGPGYLWWTNRAQIPAALDLTLTDFSAGMLAEARRLLAPTGHAFHYAVADAQQIPFADASCDVVIANHMLYHVPDRARALAEVYRVLRPGGYFYASTLGRQHMQEVRTLLRRFDAAAGYDQRFLRGVTFTLENGGAELGQWFPAVEVRPFADALVVTAAEPLADYIRSVMPIPAPGRDRADLTGFLQQELAATGALHLTSATGLFIAQRP